MRRKDRWHWDAGLWVPRAPAVVRPRERNLLPGFCIPQVIAAIGGIEFVDSATGSSTSTTDTTITLPSMEQDDLVLVGTITASSTNGGIPTTAGYTQVANVVITGTWRMLIYRKFMGASPDATVVIDSASSSGVALACIAMVFRGVDLTTPIDVTTTTNTTSTDPPSITPANNNCMIVIFAAEIDDAATTVDTTPGDVTNYSTSVVRSQTGSSNACVIASAYRLLSGGASVAENPGAFSSWSSGGDDCSATIALRPAA